MLSHRVKPSTECHAHGEALGTMHVLGLFPEDVGIGGVCMWQLRRFEAEDNLSMSFGLVALKCFDSFRIGGAKWASL